MFGLVAAAPRLPQLRRAAPDVVVALAFALGLSVVSAAGLALVLRDLQADVAFSAHVGEHRGLRRDRRLRRGAAPLVVVALLFALLLRVVAFAGLGRRRQLNYSLFDAACPNSCPVRPYFWQYQEQRREVLRSGLLGQVRNLEPVYDGMRR